MPNYHDPFDLPLAEQTHSLSESNCFAKLWPSSRVRWQSQLRRRTEQHRTPNHLHMASAAVLVWTRWIVGDVVPMGQEDETIKPSVGWRQELDGQTQSLLWGFFLLVAAATASWQVKNEKSQACVYTQLLALPDSSRHHWRPPASSRRLDPLLGNQSAVGWRVTKLDGLVVQAQPPSPMPDADWCSKTGCWHTAGAAGRAVQR